MKLYEKIALCEMLRCNHTYNGLFCKKCRYDTNPYLEKK